MSDRFRIDSHKLIYHVERVSDWRQGKNIYPLYIEASPSGICNHRCSFCALDFMGYQKRFLKTDIFKERLTEMGGLGVKSMMFGGEGEPFLHRDMVEITQHAGASGIDCAFTTNAVLLNEKNALGVLPHTSWIKVSISAGTAETYASIHNTKPADFDRVIENMKRAAEIKKAKGYSCALGMQMLLLPENKDEALVLAKTAREIGMDYLVIKPYSQHPKSETKQYGSISYEAAEKLAQELREFDSDDFNIIFRTRAMKKWDDKGRSYDRCLALPFWSYIDAGGSVWGCSMFLGEAAFDYGNLYENTFKEIWEGERRMQSLKMVSDMDASECRVNCRMDEINTYLWELTHPGEHVNFI